MPLAFLSSVSFFIDFERFANNLTRIMLQYREAFSKVTFCIVLIFRFLHQNHFQFEHVNGTV